MSFVKNLLDRVLALPRWIVIAAFAVIVVGGSGVLFIKSRRSPMMESAPIPEVVPAAQSQPVVVPNDEVLVKAQQQVVSTKSLDRKAAVESVKLVKDSAAAVKLMERLVEDADVQVRELAVKQLGNLSHPDARKLLMKALKDKDIYITVHAAESLARQGDFSGKALAVKMLAEADDQVIQMSALRTLGLSKDVALRSTINKAMKVKDPLVQQAAKEAMASLELAEKEVKDKGRLKKEEEKKRFEAKKEYDTSLNFYFKSMRDSKFPGNHAVALLMNIIKKYEPAGVDVSQAKKELLGQEKVRQVHQKKKMAASTLAPTTSMKVKPLVRATHSVGKASTVKSTASAVTSSPVKMVLTTVSPTASKVKLTTTRLTHSAQRKSPVKSTGTVKRKGTVSLTLTPAKVAPTTLIPAKVAPTAK